MTEERAKNWKLETDIKVPEGCTFAVDKKIINVKGPKGELTKKLPDPTIIIKQENGKINLSYKKTGLKQKKQLFTTAAHIKNMLKGVTEGYIYTLKICSGHFPMTVSVKGDTLEIKNFIGEKVPRTLKLKAGSKVAVNGEEITVEGNDKEVTGQVAADIEKLTRRPGFDKRIFQDGIYITDKNGKKV